MWLFRVGVGWFLLFFAPWSPSNGKPCFSALSGNRVAALQGKLSAYLSGDREDVQRAKPYLEAFCQKVTEVGNFGNGSKMKLIGNILNLVHNSVTAEVMVLGMKVGLEPELIHKAISGTFSSSAVFEGRGKLMVNNEYAVEGMNFSTPIKDSIVRVVVGWELLLDPNPTG